MSITDIILGFDQSVFGNHYQKQRYRSSKLFCGIRLNFTLVAVQSWTVHMEMYRDSVIVLLHNANLKAAFHCCLYKFSLIHLPIKTKSQPRWTKWWTIKNFLAIFNKLLSFWILKTALVDLEILEKQYITRSIWDF